MVDNDSRIVALPLRKVQIHDSLLYKKLVKNHVFDIQDALVQMERYIRLEKDKNLIGRQAAVTLQEPNKEAREKERPHDPLRQRDRRADYQRGESSFKTV